MTKGKSHGGSKRAGKRRTRQVRTIGERFDEKPAVVAADLRVEVPDRSQTEGALGKSNEWLGPVLAGGRLAAWDWHVLSGEVFWNDEHYRMFGL
jgi:hypothetical protein